MKRITSRVSTKLGKRVFSSSNIISHVGPTSQKFTSASADEMAHFNALASTWWNVDGPQRILHKMNLLRMDFIYNTVRSHIQLNKPGTPIEDEVYVPPYNIDLLPRHIRSRIIEDQEIRRDSILNKSKLRVLDVGCGGGILSESMARLSFVESVKGVDLSNDVLEAAKLHKSTDPMLSDEKLSYELTAIEDLDPSQKYNIITLFEMLEHVDYPAKVMTEALNRLEVGGWLFLSTINRDFVSWFTTIFMGEHVMRIVPVGTHTLEKYINRQEIKQWVEKNENHAFEVVDSKGCIYLPACGWKFTSKPDVGNYFMAIQRKM